MDNATREATMAKIHAAGAVLTVSLGGANDQRWESTNANTLATTVRYLIYYYIKINQIMHLNEVINLN
jgi:hypothetical protein